MAKVQRLIDAMKLVTKLSKKVRFGRIEYDDILAVIADAPTVDAVQVVHGRNVIHECDEWYQDVNCCSICGCNWMMYDNQELCFCPHCGAKLDGGADDA